jgi:release factor glutamine methyltransferase
VESPGLDADLLLAHALGIPRINLYTAPDELPDEEARTRFRDLVRRRAEGCPVAYLVGSREFFLLTFEVSPEVLIPRPETEHLVTEAIGLVRDRPAPRILDLGTGSGCIAIALAHRLPTAQVVATDVSPSALAVASRNAAKHGVSERVQFHEGDLFAAVPPGGPFDLVVSNPPYIAPEQLATLAPDVREFQPRLALDGGPDGLSFYYRLAAEAGAVLTPGGAIAVEIGADQGPAVSELFQRAGWEAVRVINDLARHPRVVLARRPSVQDNDP